MKIVKFEIEDMRGNLIQSFNSPRGVEEFFYHLSQSQADLYEVLGFDELGYLIQIWFASEVETGNFIRDVEDYDKQNNRKIVRQRRKR